MREIKFRAWNRETSKWMFGGKALTLRAISGIGRSYFDESTIWVQFTGLKDKNGKEIYEGDFLQLFELQNNSVNDHHRCFGIVRFGKYGCECNEYAGEHYGFYLDGFSEYKRVSGKVDRCYKEFPLTDCLDYEIIGNIYENPELKEAQEC